MNDAKCGFLGGIVTKIRPLLGHDPGSHEDLAMVKGDDVRRLRIFQKLPVNVRNHPVGNNHCRDFGEGQQGRFREGGGKAVRQRTFHHGTDPWQIQDNFSLTVEHPQNRTPGGSLRQTHAAGLAVFLSEEGSFSRSLSSRFG